MIAGMILLLIVPLAYSLQKPISGKIYGGAGQVDVFMEVESPFGKQTCMVQPSTSTEEDGSFSTNLLLMVLKDFPHLNCEDYWKEGDLIWYEFNHGNDRYRSEKKALSEGTLLQRLPYTSISEQPMIIQEEVVEINPPLSLTVEKKGEILQIGTDATGEREIFIFSGSRLVKKTGFSENLDLKELDEGDYGIVVASYAEGEITSLSDRAHFTIERNLVGEAIKELDQREEKHEGSKAAFAIFLVIFAATLFIVIFVVMKKK